MNNLEIRKAQLREYIEARAKATKGEWKTEYRTFNIQKTPWSNRTQETCHRVYADNNTRFPIVNTLGHEKYQFDVDNCEFIAKAANESARIAEQLLECIEDLESINLPTKKGNSTEIERSMSAVAEKMLNKIAGDK